MTSTQNILIWSKTSENGIRLFKRTEESVGFDLSSAYDVIVPAKEKAVIKTDIQVLFPKGVYGRIIAIYE